MRTASHRTPWSATVIAALLLACPSSPYRCDLAHTCAANAVCAPQGYCAERTPTCASGLRFTSSALHPGACVPPGDGGIDVAAIDANMDAATDDVTDAPTELAMDIPVDVPVDAPVDATTDAPDVAMDAAPDTPTDIARDLPVDLAPDIVTDVAPDLAMDAPVDRPADVSADLASADLPDTSTGRCAIAPQLLGPLSATRLGGGGLRLRWRNLSPAVNTIIQVSTEASFALANTYTALGTPGDMTFSLPDRPRGRYFWRVYGDCETSGRTPFSATWSFWLSGVGSGGSALGWIPDLDGDGFGDIVVGAPVLGISASDAGTVNVYLSSSGATLSTRRQTSITGSSPSFGASVAVVPDMTGDGAAELAVGSCSRASVPCYPVVRVFRIRPAAGALPPSAEPITEFTGMTEQRFGADLAGVGDLDGDGYGDMLIAAPGEYERTAGYFHVVRGGPRPTLESDPIGAPSSAATRFAWNIAGVGDVTGDGLPDALIAAFNQAWIYPGRGSSATPFASPIALGLTSAGDPDLGFVASGGGDLNGDGFADFVVGQPGAVGYNGSISIFHGTMLRDGQLPFQTITSTLMGARFGAAVAGGGDLMGGSTSPYDELVVGAPGASSNAGRVYTVSRLPGASGMYAESTQTSPTTTTVALGHAVAVLGDFNADGFDDFAAATGSTAMVTANSVSVWRGNGTAAPSLHETVPRADTGTWGYTLGER